MFARTRIKMCGTTRAEDARAAVAAGVDCLGFIFVRRSPRCLSAAEAGQIIAELPPFIARVGVFVDAPLAEIRQTVSSAGLTGVQLHGGESPEVCRTLKAQLPHLFIMKAFRVGDRSRSEEFSRYLDGVDAYLLDTYVKGVEGGTGLSFNWNIVARLALRRPVILAGGLTVGNIGRALQAVRPYGVDVNSGVELAPGRKDHEQLRRFVARVTEFDREQPFSG